MTEYDRAPNPARYGYCDNPSCRKPLSEHDYMHSQGFCCVICFQNIATACGRFFYLNNPNHKAMYEALAAYETWHRLNRMGLADLDDMEGEASG